MSRSLPPLLPHATRDLARFAAKTRYADIPGNVIDKVKRSAANLTGILAPPEIERLKSLALSIDTLPNADEIVKIVSPARSQGGSFAHRL